MPYLPAGFLFSGWMHARDGLLLLARLHLHPLLLHPLLLLLLRLSPARTRLPAAAVARWLDEGVCASRPDLKQGPACDQDLSKERIRRSFQLQQRHTNVDSHRLRRRLLLLKQTPRGFACLVVSPAESENRSRPRSSLAALKALGAATRSRGRGRSQRLTWASSIMVNRCAC